MLEITRGRKWVQSHTVMDSADGPLSDLTIFSEILSQIREKTATKDRHGFFVNKVVATCEIEVIESVIYQKLSREATLLLQTGDYLIDIVGIRDDADESLLDPEPIRVINRPTSVYPSDPIPGTIPATVPDFVAIAEEALED